MQLCKLLKFMGILTVLALTYIHMQMQIIDMAYAGNKKEQQIQKLIEQNGSTTYKILIMKSSNHLGDTVLDNGSDMQFADLNNIVHVTASQDIFADEQLAEQSQLAKRANSLLNLLSFGLEAEAKSAE